MRKSWKNPAKKEGAHCEEDDEHGIEKSFGDNDCYQEEGFVECGFRSGSSTFANSWLSELEFFWAFCSLSPTCMMNLPSILKRTKYTTAKYVTVETVKMDQRQLRYPIWLLK